MADNESYTDNITVVEDYIYDATESFSHYDWSELIPAVIVYSVVLMLGVSGNSLIIFTIARYRRLKTITNVFLASLASADLLLVLVCVPVNVAKLFSYTWTFGVFLCKFVHYMQNVSAICSVLTLTAMSIERYYAIVHPMRAQYLCTISQAKKIIGATWIASFVLAMPILWIQIQLPVGERIPAFWCVRDWDNVLAWQIYELYMLVIVLVLPSTIMAAAYGAIAREIWRVTALRAAMLREQQYSENFDNFEMVAETGAEQLNNPTSVSPLSTVNTRRSSRNMRSTEADHRTAKQVVKMLVAIVILFAICWAPFLVDNVLTSFSLMPSTRMGAAKHMRIAFHFLAYTNSCLNPLVYGFMSRNFRRGFRSALRIRSQSCCGFQVNEPRRTSSCHHRRVPTYNFSRISRTPTASLRLHDQGFVRTSVGTTTAYGNAASSSQASTFPCGSKVKASRPGVISLALRFR